MRPAVIGALVIGLAALAMAAPRLWSSLFPGATAQVVSASGRIEGREVTLAPKGIQGRVARLLTDEGESVTKGQLVAELDAAQLEAQHAAARANVATLDAQVAQAALDAAYADKNAKASIAAADAAVASAQARLAGARAVVANARSSYERARDLFGSGAISRQDLDQAEMTLHTSDAEATAADKEVARAVANLALARASADVVGLKQQQLLALQENRRSAESRLAEAEANLGERSIVAPSDGTVISRLVEVGDVVGPGTPIFQLIDLRRLYVKVYIPEPDIAKLRLGDRADVFVDAFPGRGFVGRVSRIYDQAEFTPKNVETAEERLKLVFGVEVSLDNPDSVLKPGMPADCVIHWTSIPPDAGHGS